jgi:type II secretory pathway component PulF
MADFALQNLRRMLSLIFTSIVMAHTSTAFCRTLSVLLSSGMVLPAALRLLVDIIDNHGRSARYPTRKNVAFVQK